MKTNQLSKWMVSVIALFLLSYCGKNPLSSGTDSAPAEKEDAVVGAPVASDAPLLVEQDSFYLLGGDIALNKNDEEHAEMIRILQEQPVSGLAKTSGIREMWTTLWPAGKVTYRLNGFSATETKIVRAAMDSIQKSCAVVFVPATATQTSFVYTITRVTGQSYGGMSTLGYSKTPWCYLNQVLWGTAVHEFLHGLGISHEHQRYDRDKFVTIYVSNASATYASQFAVIPQSMSYRNFATGKLVSYEASRVYGTYDYASIMHYPTWAFSANGKATIVPKQAGKTIGQRTCLSVTDKLTLITLYGKPVVKK